MGEEAQKTTLMILNVDLQCSSCYKKVKKVICKFPQIKDRKFDEKANKVFITVVCCSPEKIRDKLCCKGCGVIKSIEIVEPPKPRAAEKPKEPEKPKPPPEKPKEPEKPKPPPEKPKEPEKPKPPPEKPKEPEKPKPPPEKPKPTSAPVPVPVPAPAPAPKPAAPAPLPPPPKVPEPEPVIVMPCYPTQPPYGFCCGPCSEGIPGGPCYGWYGRPPPPPPPPPRPCYEPFFGCRCGQSRGYYGCRCECNNYYCELDNSSCSIM
nr:pollen-specific leucine-rich repeat extensin-like protein 1 [Ipomoea batatas]